MLIRWQGRLCQVKGFQQLRWRPVQRALTKMPWKRKRSWPDSPCSGRTDSIHDSEPDGNPLLLCTERIVSATTDNGPAVQQESADGAFLSLFVVLRKKRRGWNKPFQFRDMLQELIFMVSGAPQSWLRKFDLLAVSAAAENERRLSPPLCISEKNLGTSCNVERMSKCCNVRHSRLLNELRTADSWVAGTWLCRRDWLAVRL